MLEHMLDRSCYGCIMTKAVELPLLSSGRTAKDTGKQRLLSSEKIRADATPQSGNTQQTSSGNNHNGVIIQCCIAGIDVTLFDTSLSTPLTKVGAKHQFCHRLNNVLHSRM